MRYVGCDREDCYISVHCTLDQETEKLMLWILEKGNVVCPRCRIEDLEETIRKLKETEKSEDSE